MISFWNFRERRNWRLCLGLQFNLNARVHLGRVFFHYIWYWQFSYLAETFYLKLPNMYKVFNIHQVFWKFISNCFYQFSKMVYLWVVDTSEKDSPRFNWFCNLFSSVEYELNIWSIGFFFAFFTSFYSHNFSCCIM